MFGKTCLRWLLLSLSGLSLFALTALAPVQKTALATNKDQLYWDESGRPGPQEIIRFRVIAASDRPADQSLKLDVRDAVLDYLKPDLQQAGDVNMASEVIEGHLPQIRQVVQDTLKSRGSSSLVDVTWGMTDFPNKAYGPLIFPAGSYQALKIVIGSGGGKNWWCVLFPPLCYVDLTREAQSIGPDANGASGVQERITNSRPPYLTTRLGEWLKGDYGRSLLSWFWPPS
jgi:stage II sporulation protein R